MLWRPFFARLETNYRSIYSHILTRVHAVAMATGLVKALIIVFVYLKKNPVVRLFSSFAHYKIKSKLRFFVIDHSRGL